MDYGEAFGRLIQILMWSSALFVPLGLWKLIEIIIWCFNHITIK